MIRVGIAPGLRGELDALIEAQPDLTLAADLARADVVVASASDRDDLPTGVPRVLLAADSPLAGAQALLPETASDEQILAAIHAVAAGLAVRLAATDELSPLAESLTPRELQVLRLAAAGLANKQIAARLGVSEHTVKFHLASLMGKLGAGSRTEAVTAGIRQGLILL